MPSGPPSAKRGFTLIELLVVVAIIGVLASVTLTALQTARNRAADAGVRSQTAQLRTIFAQELNDTGSYASIKNGGEWKGVGDTCSSASFSPSTYAAKAAEICTALVKATGTPCGDSGCVYFRTTAADSPTKYSIVAYLPGVSRTSGTATFLCMGSSGRTSQTTDPFATPLPNPGCYNDP